MSNAPHNPTHVPTHVEVDEPTQPYSRAKIDRLRQVAKAPPQEPRLDAEPPDVTLVSTVSTRGMLTAVPDDADQDAGDPGMQGWFELDGRRLRVCLGSFAHFGFSGAPPGMIGAVDTSLVSGTIGRERSAVLPLGPQRFEVEQAQADQTPAPELLQRFSRRHKWKLWVLVATPLALALAAWAFARNDAGPVQPMTRDAEQVRADVPSQPAEVAREVPSAMPIAMPIEKPSEVFASPASETEMPPHEETPTQPKPRNDFGACDKHRKLAADAKDGGDWARLLELAQRRSCWSRVSANALQMEALFELGRYRECVALGARDGSKKEIQKWRNACQLNL